MVVAIIMPSHYQQLVLIVKANFSKTFNLVTCMEKCTLRRKIRLGNNKEAEIFAYCYVYMEVHLVFVDVFIFTEES
jgi:LEA14-like dessication related protein